MKTVIYTLRHGKEWFYVEGESVMFNRWDKDDWCLVDEKLDNFHRLYKKLL